MVKLTEAQRQVLANPPFGYCTGSNMWPLVHMEVGGNHVADGEEIDALLRYGLLVAEPLDASIFVENGSGDIPDNELTHRLHVTDAGRAALIAPSASAQGGEL